MVTNISFKSMAQMSCNILKALGIRIIGFILCEKILLLCHIWLDVFHVEKLIFSSDRSWCCFVIHLCNNMPQDEGLLFFHGSCSEFSFLFLSKSPYYF